PNCARASPHTASPSQPRLRNVTFRAGHRAESAVSRWLYRRSRSKNVLPTKTTRSPSTSSNGFFVAWAPRRESRSRYFTAAATPKFGSRCIELARDYTSWTEIRKSKIEKRTAGPLFSGFRIRDSGFGIRAQHRMDELARSTARRRSERENGFCRKAMCSSLLQAVRTSSERKLDMRTTGVSLP